MFKRKNTNDGIKLLQKLDCSCYVFFGFSKWKHSFIKEIFEKECVFFTELDANNKYFYELFIKKKNCFSKAFVWSYNDPFWLRTFCEKNKIDLCRVEDGFIRSLDLGAKKTPPMSLVFDDSDYLYFDAVRKSKLHSLIRNCKLNEDEKSQVEKIKKVFLQNNLSKYNLNTQEENHFPNLSILVIGQNETDLSIKKSGSIFSDNESLVRYVIEKNPNHHIIYKPHPDTLNNQVLRKSFPENLPEVQVVNDLTKLFKEVDKIIEVHTISSLLGFEFMLRGCKVYCYSRTWYSGWGLSEDCYLDEDHRLSIDLTTLFYCAYILYPRYYNEKYDEISIIEVMDKLLNYAR